MHLVHQYIFLYRVELYTINLFFSSYSEVIEVSGGHTTTMMKAIIIETPFGTELSNLIINICNSTGLTKNLNLDLSGLFQRKSIFENISLFLLQTMVIFTISKILLLLPININKIVGISIRFGTTILSSIIAKKILFYLSQWLCEKIHFISNSYIMMLISLITIIASALILFTLGTFNTFFGSILWVLSGELLPALLNTLIANIELISVALLLQLGLYEYILYLVIFGFLLFAIIDILAYSIRISIVGYDRGNY